ncbi:DUF1707 domain-containing protein [Micromonospora sp. NPDC000207]|uniref:DUF1707 domain-containing protein n=1 Tax=Micromonospora sp. NPDC000207 TaxID=3154246 RepID=UPI0033274DB8
MEQERHNEIDRLRVSDREREEVVALLGQAVSEGRLTLAEYEERVGTAHASLTRGELATVTVDLPNAPGRPSAEVVSPPQEQLKAIFGSEVRKGAWAAPEHIEARAVFGDCRIELHEIPNLRPVTRIDAEAIFGSVVVVVPEGTEVRLTGSAVFGDKKSKMRGPYVAGAPVVEVRCRVIFGDVTVRPPRQRWW